MPRDLNIEPRYNQRKIDDSYSTNTFQPIVAPLGTDGVVNINQDAYFSIANIDSNMDITYNKTKSLNGVYFFLIKGELSMGVNTLFERDGIGITDEDCIWISTQKISTLLCIEVPMK